MANRLLWDNSGGTFRNVPPLLTSGGIRHDIHRAKASGTAAGMGRSNSGLQKQRVVSPAVVQGEGNNDNYILSLGTGTVVCCQFNDTAD